MFGNVILGKDDPPGQLILQMRTNLGMTRGELCKQANVHSRTMARLEHGALNIPFDVLERLFDALGMEMSANFKKQTGETDDAKEIPDVGGA